jgi:hypothetical protein
MIYTLERSFAFKLPVLVLLLAAVCAGVAAQKKSGPGAAAAAAPAGDPKTLDEPVFREYKGVQLGMSADEARKKLGSPSEKGDTQDFYVFSDKESAQVFYDEARKVSAVAVTFMGEASGAPTAKAVLGTEIEAKADGSMYKMVRYPKAGFWVSYSLIVGDAPMVAVTMQKMSRQN